jgi:AcrR family transcriptional regulator
MKADSAPRTARDFARVELTRQIRECGRRQLASVGPGELSLRAVARELGMASSAVYRYFPSRDHLITAMLVECYDELGAAVEQAETTVRRDRLRKRWLVATGALRAWARANRHEYALLFGSPVPGYAAPEDTVLPARRVPVVLLTLVGDSEARGTTLGSPARPLPRAASASIAPISELFDARIGDERLMRALMAWSTLIGAITLELFGHLQYGVLDYDVHFTQVCERLADDLGLS